MSNNQMSLSETQEESFKALKVIKDICDSQNIKYWLSFGTLLGAIRHNDFIPWDDDIDINMPRKDYEKFVEYCINHQEELLPYRLFDYRTCEEYIYPIGRFSNTNFVFKSYVKDYGLGIFIDIYPMDGYDANDSYQLKQIWKKKKIIGRLIADKCPPTFSKPKFILLRIIQKIYGVNTLHNRLKELDLLAQKHNYDDSVLVSALNWEPAYYYKKEYFDRLEPHIFHGEYFSIPSGYHALLSDRYGNYMELPPEDQRVPHHDYEMYRK